MKLSKQLVLILFVFTTFSAFAQGNFKKAFIVKNNNDTVNGLIDYTTPKDITVICSFRKDSNSQIINYNPTDLKSFGYDKGKLFVSKEVQYNDTILNLYLEFLLKGVVNLYYCKYKSEDVFYVEKDSVFMQLSNYEKIVIKNDKNYFFNSNTYIGILKYLLSDAESISDKIDKTNYNFLSLIKLLKDYHYQICDDRRCIVYYKKEKKLNDVKWKIKYGLSLVYSFTSIDVTSDFMNSYTNQDIPEIIPIETNSNYTSSYNCMSPVLFINLSRHTRSSFQFELGYKHLKNSFLEFSSIDIPIIYNYNFMYYKKASPFVNIGLSNILNYGTKSQDLYFKFNQRVDIKNINNRKEGVYVQREAFVNREAFELNNLNMGLSIGGGVKFTLPKKDALKLEFRWHSPIFNFHEGSVDGYAMYQSKRVSSNSSILLSYVFK